MKLNEGRTTLGLTSQDMSIFDQLLIKANKQQLRAMIVEIAREDCKRDEE